MWGRTTAVLPLKLIVAASRLSGRSFSAKAEQSAAIYICSLPSPFLNAEIAVISPDSARNVAADVRRRIFDLIRRRVDTPDAKATPFVIYTSYYSFCRLTSCHLPTYFRPMLESEESIANIRGQLKLTQSDFAKKLGISRQHLSKLENSPRPISTKLARRIQELYHNSGFSNVSVVSGIRAIAVKSWAQAGIGVNSEELPLDWQKRVATDCPDENAFAVEIQGDSMEPKCFPGDIAILMPSHQPRNGSLVVAKLEEEGVVLKVFTAREQSQARICSFTSYNPVFRPIEIPEARVLWNYPVYQIIRQIWR